MANKIITHDAQTLARLPQQLKDKPRIAALLSAFATQVQDLENALWQLLTERDIDSAIGAQLDAIGRLVGQTRAGEVDADYRRLVRARVSANRSRGTAEDILTVARQVINDSGATIELESQRIADVVVRVLAIVMSTTTADTLVGFMGDVVTAGVRIIVEYPLDTDAETFRFDSADPGKGFGDEAVPSVGGKIATARVG